MKLTNISIRNVMGARRIDLAPRTPITLIGGDNGEGKSSVQEAVRMAFSGQTIRVGLKKDFHKLVSDGAKKGSITVQTDDGTATFEVPTGSRALSDGLGLGLPDALPFVLDPRAFIRLGADDRRTFLFNLTGCQVTEKRVRDMLAEAGCVEDLVNETLPMLKTIAGFPAAAKFADDKAKDARGAWRGLTGEAYGGVKAKDWTAQKPEFDDEMIAQTEARRDTCEKALRAAQTALATLKANKTSYLNEMDTRAKHEQAAQGLMRLRVKLKTDKQTLADVESKLNELTAQAGEGPRVGLEHDFARAVEFVLDSIDGNESLSVLAKELRTPFDTYVGKFGVPSNSAGDPDARAKLPEYKTALTGAQNAVNNTERAIAAAEQSEKYVIETTEPAPVSDADIVAAEQEADSLQCEYRQIDEKLIKLQIDKRAATEADEKTKTAAKHHRDVVEWLKLAQQLGPEGVPAQLVAQALKPFNTRLRASSLETEWRQPQINPDMSITAEGRDYALLCESEKWRVDAMIAEAISTISKVGVLILDRVDVLHPTQRVQLLVWLAGRAEDSAINTAILFATLKQPALGMPKPISCEWIREGELLDTDQIAEAFPALRDKLLASASYRQAA